MVTAFTLSMFILPAAWKIKLQLMGRFGRRRISREAEKTREA
jgi:hypothetical protein